MDELNHEMWTAAAQRFCEFVRNLPLIVDEEDVGTYNEIIEEFENASGFDLSRFRATAERKPDPRNSKQGWQTRLPATVDRSRFVSGILEFAQFLRSSFAPPPCDGRIN